MKPLQLWSQSPQGQGAFSHHYHFSVIPLLPLLAAAGGGGWEGPCHYAATVNFSDGLAGWNTQRLPQWSVMPDLRNTCVWHPQGERGEWKVKPLWKKSLGLKDSQILLTTQSYSVIRGEVKVNVTAIKPVVNHRCCNYLITMDYWRIFISSSWCTVTFCTCTLNLDVFILVKLLSRVSYN